ncbi:MAG: tRNA pseudouridine(13) synthase TruD [Candidatus Njordarchaeia archaeon]
MRTDVPIIDQLFGMRLWGTSIPGIKGVIKERSEDFIVEEILPNGHIIELNNPKLPHTGYEGLFTHFILQKKGIGSFEAKWLLSKFLKIPVSWIFFAGNKDKDALTIQRAAVWNVPPEELSQINISPRLKILSPIRELRRLHIGDLYGNRFTILIRKIPLHNEVKIKKFTNMLQEGLYLPNFFSYQRFGILNVCTHFVGKLVLLGNYDEAIKIYLTTPSPLDSPQVRLAREKILERDFKTAKALLPKEGFIVEKLLLSKLNEGRSAEIAFKKLPLYILRMIVESYQSYLFNQILSTGILENIIPYEERFNKKLPLIGYRILDKLPSDIKYLVDVVLEKEGINYKLFTKKAKIKTSLVGGWRPMMQYIKVTVSKIGKKEDFLSLLLRFILRKGEYATNLLREIFKENILFSLFSKRIALLGEKLFLESVKRWIDFNLKYMSTYR